MTTIETPLTRPERSTGRAALVAFGALLGIGALGTFMFLLAWRAPAHGYGTPTTSAA